MLFNKDKENDAEKYFQGQDLALVQALERDDMEEVKSLLDAGSDLNRPGKDGVYPLLYFIERGDARALARLVESGAALDVGLERPLGDFADDLGSVAAADTPEMLQAMLAAGMDPNVRVRGTDPLIFYAITPLRRENLELLLRAGADINLPSKYTGTTLLHNAVFRDEFDLAYYLVERGADATIGDVDGHTAVDVLARSRATTQPGAPVEREILDFARFLGNRGVSLPAELRE